MDSKKFTQYGLVSILIALPMLIIPLIMLNKFGFFNFQFIVFHILILVSIFVLLFFYKLTIIIEQTTISFYLGVGLFKRTYKLSDIQSCTSVKNSIANGIGIKMLSNGWLYNVSGLKAIELQFNNKKSIVRIGTDKPDEICEIVNSRLYNDNSILNSNEKSKKWINPTWIISLSLIPIIILLVFIPNFRDARFQINQDSFEIKGIYKVTIPLNEIVSVDTVSILPKIALRTNGYAFGQTLIGNFRLKDDSNVKMFVKRKVKPFIVIKSKFHKPVYINFKDKNKTIDLYNELKK